VDAGDLCPLGLARRVAPAPPRRAAARAALLEHRDAAARSRRVRDRLLHRASSPLRRAARRRPRRSPTHRQSRVRRHPRRHRRAMHPTPRPFLTLLLLLAATAGAQRDKAREVARDGPRLSPFRGVRAVKDGLEVQVADDAWFALESLAGVDTATLLARS